MKRLFSLMLAATTLISATQLMAKGNEATFEQKLEKSYAKTDKRCKSYLKKSEKADAAGNKELANAYRSYCDKLKSGEDKAKNVGEAYKQFNSCCDKFEDGKKLKDSIDSALNKKRAKLSSKIKQVNKCIEDCKSKAKKAKDDSTKQCLEDATKALTTLKASLEDLKDVQKEINKNKREISKLKKSAKKNTEKSKK